MGVRVHGAYRVRDLGIPEFRVYRVYRVYGLWGLGSIRFIWCRVYRVCGV